VLDEPRKTADFNLAGTLVIQDDGTARLDLSEADATTWPLSLRGIVNLTEE
jgi:hypothetical protein